LEIFVAILIIILRIYTYILLLRIILSWFRIMPRGRIWGRAYKLLEGITEPFLQLFRRFVPLVRMGRSYLDLSYIAAILVVQLLVILLRYVVLRYI
jgi:YggT family protein